MREVAELQPPGHRGRVGPADGGLPDMRRAALGPKFLECLISFCTESPDGGADGLCCACASSELGLRHPCLACDRGNSIFHSSLTPLRYPQK